jgi:hypothetical protein
MAIDPQLTISYVCPKSATLKQHVHEEHRDEDGMPWRREFTPCVYQTVFGNHSPAFQVRRPVLKEVSSFDILLQTALAAVTRVSVSAQGTTRDVTPFLRKYSWISHVNGYEIDDLMALVDYRTQDYPQLETLADRLQVWMAKVDRALPESLTLREILAIKREDPHEK